MIVPFKGSYIGDGVYLSNDGYQLWLAVNHHFNKVVAMDSQVFTDFLKEGSKQMAEIHGVEAVRQSLQNALDALP